MIIKRLLKTVLVCLALVVALLTGPLYIMLSGSHDTGSNWRTSSRDSAGLAPPRLAKMSTPLSRCMPPERFDGVVTLRFIPGSA